MPNLPVTESSDDDSSLPEHPFAQYVRIVGRGKRARRDFSRQEAAASMTMILDGAATPAQIGAWLMLLRVKEETPEELAGFVDACRAHIHLLHGELPTADVDWPSYAGKKKHSPWYLLAALLLAESGIRIIMHGGPAHTPARLYTDQVLAALGRPMATRSSDIRTHLDQANFCYIGIDTLCPPLADLLSMRFELGLRSPINTLSRCLNPLGADLMLQSVFHPAYIALQQGAAQLLEEPQLLLFKGEGGEVEIRPDADTRLFGLENGAVFERIWPAHIPRHSADQTPSVDELRAVWRGESEHGYGELATIQTMAVVLRQLRKAPTDQAAQQLAQSLWAQRDRAAL